MAAFMKRPLWSSRWARGFDRHGAGSRRYVAESGTAAFEAEIVERWCIAAAAPDHPRDERAAPSHTMIGSGSA
jgi:hypothetical protein